MNVIQKTFGHIPFYLYAKKGDKLCGVLPLFLVKTKFFGKMLVSNAFAVYGGAIGDGTKTKQLLTEEAIRLGKKYNVDYVEFRHFENGTASPKMQRSELYVTFRQELFDEPERNFQIIPREGRRLVRRAKEAGLWAEFGCQRVDDFYRIYSTNMRDLGTPIFPKKLFKNFLDEFPDDTEIVFVWLGNLIVASVFTFYFRDTVMPYYAGSLQRFNNNKIAPNNFMYWSLIEDSIRRNLKWFDFGRSKVNTGAYHFKRHFGMNPEPLNYQYALLNKKEMPNLNPLNPKFQLGISIWKRIPVPITRVIGPGIVKNIP